MGGFKKYCKDQFQVQKFNVEHDVVSDFYLSCWQRNRTALPVLCLRTLLFLFCLAILLASAILTGSGLGFGYWPIFLTHWGLIFITVTSGFALAVSCVAFMKGPLEASFGLPWYVKVYWALYDTTIPLAFFITIYYYIFLSAIEEFDVDPLLDVFIHAINSVLMLILLMTSRQPARLLHFYLPLALGIIYLLFSVIYYFAGGTDPFGNNYIYPTLDWSDPGQTTLMVLVSAVAFVVVHFLVVGLTVLRDAVTRRYRRDSKTISVSNDTF